MPRPLAPEKASAVLADVPSLGVTGAARKHGVSPATASRLAKRNGVATFQAQTREAVEARKRTTEQRRAEVGERLWEIADKATTRELELLAASKLYEVVGARTRAIHDAQLLSGEATSRSETIDRDVSLERLDELAERRERKSA